MEVHSLWIGDRFSLLEKLTMKSFLDNGYKFNLWIYNNALKEEGVEGVSYCDANEILPKSRIFVYDGLGDCRSGSLGGFSDLFRYYLIQKVGGMYVDMDVTCLNHFTDDSDYLFRPHNRMNVVANIFKAPINAPFLQECINRTEQHVDKNNNEWVKPVQILADVVKEYDLEKYIAPKDYFGNDTASEVYDYKTQNYFLYQDKLPKYAIHWCRECSFGTWGYKDVYDWDRPKPLSLYYNLLHKYKLL